MLVCTARFPAMLAAYNKLARQCAEDSVDNPRYLLRLVELEAVESNAGKPAKVAISAIMRKLVVLANTLLRHGRTWSESPA